MCAADPSSYLCGAANDIMALPAPPSSPNASTAPAPALTPAAASCISNPSQVSCGSYVYPGPYAYTDLDSLCKAMPFMTMCPLYVYCNASTPVVVQSLVRGCAKRPSESAITMVHAPGANYGANPHLFMTVTWLLSHCYCHIATVTPAHVVPLLSFFCCHYCYPPLQAYCYYCCTCLLLLPACHILC